MTSKELNKILSKHEKQQEELLLEQERWKKEQTDKIKVIDSFSGTCKMLCLHYNAELKHNA